MAFRAPLLGYNTNVRHKGKLYHIQTEDSGIGHPHIITHLFADGGRIVASKKTSYAEQVGREKLQESVKKLMQAQHKAMFIALRDGIYDDDSPNDAAREQTGLVPLPSERPRENGPRPAASASAAPEAKQSERPSLYQGTRAARPASERPAEDARAPKGPVSIFGGDLLSEKSLDEVILSYLATDETDER
jgi:hypothetical protein